MNHSRAARTDVKTELVFTALWLRAGMSKSISRDGDTGGLVVDHLLLLTDLMTGMMADWIEY